jgi:hypothetical protein
MSEAEEQVAVEPQQGDDAPSAAEEAPAPAKPQARIKRPSRPDDEAYKSKVEALQQTSGC